MNDGTHGPQFCARFLRTSAPTTAEGIEKYLASRMIRGIGPGCAKRLACALPPPEIAPTMRRSMARLEAAHPNVTVVVDGTPVSVPAGVSLAAALMGAGYRVLRLSPRAGTPRGAFCLMGACQECVVLIDGRVARACATAVVDGLSVSLHGPDRA